MALIWPQNLNYVQPGLQLQGGTTGANWQWFPQIHKVNKSSQGALAQGLWEDVFFICLLTVRSEDK